MTISPIEIAICSFFRHIHFITPRQVTLGGAGAPATTVWAFLGRFGKMCRLRNGQEKENLDGKSESKESRHFTSVPNFSCPLLVESISAGWPTLGSGAGPTFVLVPGEWSGWQGWCRICWKPCSVGLSSNFRRLQTRHTCCRVGTNTFFSGIRSTHPD